MISKDVQYPNTSKNLNEYSSFNRMSITNSNNMDSNETSGVIVRNFSKLMNEGMSSQNPKNHTDLMWQTHMQMLMKRKRSMEIAQTIDNAIYEYYSEKGISVPRGKQKKIHVVDRLFKTIRNKSKKSMSKCSRLHQTGLCTNH